MISIRSSSSRRRVPIHRWAIASLGAPASESGGCESPRWRTRHQNAGELAVVVPNHKPELGCAVSQVHQEVACLLGHPGAIGVGSDPKDVGATGRVFYHEQHIQPLQQQRVDTEEIGGKNAPGLRPQKLPPAWPVTARSGIDAGPLENRPHGTGRNLVAKPSDFAMESSVAPEEFSAASRSTNRRSSGAVRRPPLRWFRG